MEESLLLERERLVKEFQDVEGKRKAQVIPTRIKKPLAFGMEMPEEFAERRPYASAAYETLKEGIAIPGLNLFDMASFGTIRGAVEKAGETWPEAKTMPGKALELGAKATGLVKSPIMRALGLLKAPAAAQIPTVARAGLTGAMRGAAGGALYAPKDITDIKARARQALVGGAIGGVVGAGIGLVQHNLQVRPEKVKQIKKGMKEYWRGNQKEYGKLLKQAGIEGGEIDPLDTLDYMEKELTTKGIIDRLGKKIAPPQDKVDRALFKGYEKLRDKFFEAGGQKIPAKEVVEAGRVVEAAGKRVGKFKPSVLGREARRLEEGIAETYKSKLRNQGKSFEEAQKLWANFRNRFDLVNKHFDVWESNLATGKGEKALEKIMSSGELRTVANIITQETGITLGTEKVINVITSPVVRQLAGTIGLMAALIYAARQMGKQLAGETTPTQSTGGGG